MTISDRFTRVNPEVFHASTDIVTFDRNDVRELNSAAAANPRGRARLCAHRDPSAKLHDMLIVLSGSDYIRPHRHHGRDESSVIVSGEVTFVYFDEKGVPTAVHELGTPDSGAPFFIRTPAETFHTLLVKSKSLTFLEAIEGPFERERTEFAPWSPVEGDAAGIARFREKLHKDIAPLLKKAV